MGDIFQFDTTGIAAKYKQEQYLKEAEEYRLRIRAAAGKNTERLQARRTQCRQPGCCASEEVSSQSCI